MYCLAGLTLPPEAELAFNERGVEMGSGLRGEPFAVKFLDLVHKSDGAVVVKGVGFVVFE